MNQKKAILIYQTTHVSTIEDQMFESFGDALLYLYSSLDSLG